MKDRNNRIKLRNKLFALSFCARKKETMTTNNVESEKNINKS